MPSQSSQIYQDAELIYNYHRLNHFLFDANIILCLCSLDIRVAHRAADLYLQGYAPLLVFSGDKGALTEGLFDRPEAHVFADIAVERGVPRDHIIVEPESTNTGENLLFTHRLLGERGIETPTNILLVQKPYMERRAFATFCKQWPDQDVKVAVTSPQMSFDEYPNEENSRELITSIMVGDLDRIRDYPAKGYQIEQEIPAEVWEARNRLVEAGYDTHLP